VYRLFNASGATTPNKSFSCLYSRRNGTRWYLRETFLQPRTDRCCSVSRRCVRITEVRVTPETAVLQRSSEVSREAMGTMTRMKTRSRAQYIWPRSGESTPGEPTVMVGWGWRKDSVFHARG
jgi:hypothetical protein